MKIKLITLVTALLLSTLSFAQSDILMVGLSGLDMKPKLGIPLAGYGSKKRRLPEFVDWKLKYPECTLFRPSEGEHSPIRAKAMAIKKGKNQLIFVSLDTIGIEHSFIKDLARNLIKHGVSEKDLIVAATHTHGGPGTLSRRLPLQVIAVDFFKAHNYAYILEQVTKSIETALAAQVPADLYKSQSIIEGVQKNKWRRKDEDHFDKKATFVVARSKVDGQWLGGLVNFSIHGGSMPIELLHYSSDVNGAIEHKLENILQTKNILPDTKPVFLFMNGAEGDVGGNGGRSVEIVEDLATKFAEQSQNAFEEEALKPIRPEFFSVKKKVFLGLPASPLRNCVGGFARKLPQWMRINLFPFLPASSYISLTQLGDITFLSWPGEPSTQLGYDLQAMAKSYGAVDPIVLGLANDYMTYFTTKSEFHEGAYDSCSSLYGWKGGERIIKGHEKLLKKNMNRVVDMVKGSL